MTETNETIERYYELKQQIASLHDELDTLQPAVLEMVSSAGGKLADDRFTASIQKRPKYKFSDDYESKNSELKALRKKEIDDGIATIESETEFISFRIRAAKE